MSRELSGVILTRGPLGKSYLHSASCLSGRTDSAISFVLVCSPSRTGNQEMHHRSSIPMFRLLSRYPFRQSSTPRSPFPLKPTTTISNHIVSTPISPPKSFFSIPKLSNLPSLLRPIDPTHQTHHTISTNPRNLNTESEPSVDHSKEIDEINLKFAEAREEIEMALESKETVYFDEEAECAREAVKAVLDMFGGLLAKMGESERGALQRSMGLKIEQLKAELEQLND